MGAAIAGRARQHQLRLADVKIRAVRRTNSEPARGIGDGGLARFCFLRALFHSRSLAVAFHNAVFLRAVWSLEIRDGKLSLVRRDRRDRNDSVEGNLLASRRLRCDRGRCLLHLKLFQQTGRFASCATIVELCRSCSRGWGRRRADRLFLFGDVLSLERIERTLSGLQTVVRNRKPGARPRKAVVLLAQASLLVRAADFGRPALLHFSVDVQECVPALFGDLWSGDSDRLQHRQIQNALVHHQFHLAVLVHVRSTGDGCADPILGGNLSLDRFAPLRRARFRGLLRAK